MNLEARFMRGEEAERLSLQVHAAAPREAEAPLASSPSAAGSVPSLRVQIGLAASMTPGRLVMLAHEGAMKTVRIQYAVNMLATSASRPGG